MPQGKRKTPFSGKAKKEQLKLKKSGKQFTQQKGCSHLLLENSNDLPSTSNTKKLNYQPNKSGSSKPNKYALHFHKESKEEIKHRKEIAMQTLQPVSEIESEINGEDYFPGELDFPKRPTWSYELTKEQLEAKENNYFTEYIQNIETKFELDDLSFFEMNLETWRQLWRVIEMADIILYIVDVRYAALMFPPSLYKYAKEVLHKEFILVLNKIDLAPASVILSWKHYFETKFPDIHIIMFTTLPGYNLVGNNSNKSGLQIRRKRGKIRMAAEGAQVLFDVCKNIVGNDVDLSTWDNKIKEEMNIEENDDEKIKIDKVIDIKSVDTTYFEHEKYRNGILTIGCLGQPNVGKSSLMNALMGKKVVSVSRTPGHTKHFQTIFLTSNVRLCDCPGLVFPSKVPKVLQVLMGSFPIAQLREPFTTVKYLAERLDLQSLLRIDHPDNDDTWSAMDICDGWAKKRGYLTAKAARLDSYRAANAILRMALDGKICLYLTPPEFHKKQDFWSSHPDINKVLWIQAKSAVCSSSHNVVEQNEDSDVSGEEYHEHLASGATDSSNHSSDSETDGVGEVNLVSNKFAVLQE